MGATIFRILLIAVLGCPCWNTAIKKIEITEMKTFQYSECTILYMMKFEETRVILNQIWNWGQIFFNNGPIWAFMHLPQFITYG